jgi:hypothetical protein
MCSGYPTPRGIDGHHRTTAIAYLTSPGRSLPPPLCPTGGCRSSLTYNLTTLTKATTATMMTDTTTPAHKGPRLAAAVATPNLTLTPSLFTLMAHGTSLTPGEHLLAGIRAEFGWGWTTFERVKQALRNPDHPIVDCLADRDITYVERAGHRGRAIGYLCKVANTSEVRPKTIIVLPPVELAGLEDEWL